MEGRMQAWCRGCSREFKVDRTSLEYLIEVREGKRHWHPRIDTDLVEEANPT